eukprot:CAMPEP_0114507714 /NCGR_PEP_ID=MMETSP0109-20121206/12169_1 /TAXON_ID=29199 /ORGANISM="Chlorarachnion reptans, Strain CCCM449" /LENGTH=439 /DNA_ID=CAMNT_0001686509 /DNA_START=174 /DNA_END=1493 /DNA_ORIENTATION=-
MSAEKGGNRSETANGVAAMNNLYETKKKEDGEFGWARTEGKEKFRSKALSKGETNTPRTPVPEDIVGQVTPKSTKLRTTAIFPPFRFEEAEFDVYRGAYPTYLNFSFLARKRLRSIISLIPEKPNADLKGFADAHGITLHWHKVKRYKESVNISQDLARTIVEEIVKPENHPLYLHCVDGLHVTGLVMMCLRKLQYWETKSIYDEFARFVPERSVPGDEKEFLDSFDGTSFGILIPRKVPRWLWKGKRITRHPTVKIVTSRQRSLEQKSALEGGKVPRNDSSLEHFSSFPVFFVDPLSSSNRQSVASFDTLLCSPDNLEVCARTASKARAFENNGEPSASPPPIIDIIPPPIPHDVRGRYLGEESREFRPSEITYSSVLHSTAGQESSIMDETVGVQNRYYPCPYIAELLIESAEQSSLIRALALEGMSGTPPASAFID